MKKTIYLCSVIGGVIGGFIGSKFDHGSITGAWGIIVGTIGTIAGIVVGAKIGSE